MSRTASFLMAASRFRFYSKTLSIPGERIGYIALTPEIDDCADMFAGLTASMRYLGYVNAPSLQQKMLLKCVDASVDVSIYEKNRNLLYNSLTEIGYDCIRPDGAFYLFMRALEEDDWEFCQKAKQERLLMAPGKAFYGPGFVRISYCVPYEVVKNSIPAFQRLWDRYHSGEF
jgi:aspartate aminotransferase